ncbi:MAG: cation transporter [Nanoarchaeota archaeon]|nr:cation transporter [Nanoarchaeota archaeon]
MKKEKFDVSGMHCKSCEMLLSDTLDETDGIRSSQASNEKGEVIVEYDEKIVNSNKIRELIKEAGYMPE